MKKNLILVQERIQTLESKLNGSKLPVSKNIETPVETKPIQVIPSSPKFSSQSSNLSSPVRNKLNSTSTSKGATGIFSRQNVSKVPPKPIHSNVSKSSQSPVIKKNSSSNLKSTQVVQKNVQIPGLDPKLQELIMNDIVDNSPGISWSDIGTNPFFYHSF